MDTVLAVASGACAIVRWRFKAEELVVLLTFEVVEVNDREEGTTIAVER